MGLDRSRRLRYSRFHGTRTIKMVMTEAESQTLRFVVPTTTTATARLFIMYDSNTDVNRIF